jgi:hypothetical protein
MRQYSDRFETSDEREFSFPLPVPEQTYSENCYKVEQEEDEELRRFSPQPSKEVQDNIKASSNGKFHRNVHYNTGHSFGEGMVEGIRSLFLNNRTLTVQRVDFGDGNQSVQENSEEENASLLEETRGIIAGAIED